MICLAGLVAMWIVSPGRGVGTHRRPGRRVGGGGLRPVAAQRAVVPHLQRRHRLLLGGWLRREPGARRPRIRLLDHLPLLPDTRARDVRRAGSFAAALPEMSSWLGPGEEADRDPGRAAARPARSCAGGEEPISAAPSITTFCVFVAAPPRSGSPSDASSVVMFVIFALCSQPLCGLIEIALAAVAAPDAVGDQAVDVVRPVRVLL